MNSLRRALAFVGVLGVGLAFGQGCRPAGEESPELPGEPAKAPNEGMRGIKLRNFQVGDMEWVLEADTASVFREKKSVVAEDVNIDFFSGAKHVSKLTAEQGILNQATDDLEARGNVKVTTDEGAVLTTDVLFWDHQAAKIHTDQYVEIAQDGNTIAGVGLQADPGLDRVEIQREVRGTLRNEPRTDGVAPADTSGRSNP